MTHVLSAVELKTFQDRLASDLEFAQYEIKKHFQSFMKHAVKISEAFEIGDRLLCAEEANESNRLSLRLTSFLVMKIPVAERTIVETPKDLQKSRIITLRQLLQVCPLDKSSLPDKPRNERGRFIHL